MIRASCAERTTSSGCCGDATFVEVAHVVAGCCNELVIRVD